MEKVIISVVGKDSVGIIANQYDDDCQRSGVNKGFSDDCR